MGNFSVRTVRLWHRLTRDDVQSPALGFWNGWMRLCGARPHLRADSSVNWRFWDQRPPDALSSWNDPVTLWMPSVVWSVLVWSSRSRLFYFLLTKIQTLSLPWLGKKSRSWQHLLVIASLSCFSLVLLISVSGSINIRNFCVFTTL